MEPALSLVLPAFNEQERLPGALEAIAAFAQSNGLEVEVVVADDGSTDATSAIAAAWAAGDTPGVRVKVVRISHRGKGAAVRAGMQAVTGAVVGYCDVDMSAGPDALEKLLPVAMQGGRLVIASRGLPDSVLEVRQPWYRERAGRVFNAALRRMTGISQRDTQCGLKLCTAEVAQELFRHQRLDGFAFDAELVVLATGLGFEVDEVPIRWAHREGSKLSLVRDSVRMSRDMLRIVRRLGRVKVHPPGIPTATAMEAMAASEDLHWWYVAKRRVVAETLERWARPGRCLDVGCGAGATIAGSAPGMDGFGVDLSALALGHARARGLDRLARAEAGSLPFASGSFSAALALDVLEHHPRPESFLAEIQRVLEGGGVLVVTVPAFQWMWSYADHVLGHYRRYTRRQLSKELRSAGFDLERVTYFHSWLLPVAWLFRKLRAAAGRTESADDFPLPRPLNRLLLGVSGAELAVLRRRDLPFGLSVLGVARSPARTTAPGAGAGSAAVAAGTRA